MSRIKMEESLAMMNNNGTADSDTASETEEADNNSEDIPTIVVDPVDDGREVSYVLHIDVNQTNSVEFVTNSYSMNVL